MNKDSNLKKLDEEVMRSDSSKVGDVFLLIFFEEYVNKFGRVSGIVGYGYVVDDEEDDDDVVSEFELDEDYSGDDDDEL